MDSLYTQENAEPSISFDELPATVQPEPIEQTELYRKHLYYNRFYNLRPRRPAQISLVDPGLLVMLNHFYDLEIKRYKFRNIDLEVSLDKIVFNDLNLNNM